MHVPIHSHLFGQWFCINGVTRFSTARDFEYNWCISCTHSVIFVVMGHLITAKNVAAERSVKVHTVNLIPIAKASHVIT